VIASGLSTGGSVKRTLSITSHNFWHTFGGVFLLAVVTIIIGIVISLLLSVFFFVSDVYTVILGGVVSSVLITPLNFVFQAVLYRDLDERSGIQSQQQLW
jgi:hypothetical protein